MANGALGYLAMVFADRLGLPPHLNFLLLIAWFILLGVEWWRAAAGEPRERRADRPADASVTA
jgi:hypothetical protein